MDRDGNLIEDPIEVDLNDKDTETGKPFRSIVTEVNVNTRNLNLNQILA
jgi:hypothetical protein